MGRLAPIHLEALEGEQRRAAEGIVASRGGLRGPFEPWLRRPELADLAQRLGEYCRFRTTLPPKLSELAILLTGRYWQAQFEFWAHARLAREAGLPEAIIEAIRTGAPPPFEDEQQQAIAAFVTEYLETHRVSDATYARALAALGEEALVDLVGIVGYYSLVSMTLNVFEVDLPEGVAPPLA